MYQHSGGDFPLSSLTMTTSRGQIILLSSTGKIRCVHVLRKDISSSSLDSAGMCMCNIDSRFNSNFFWNFQQYQTVLCYILIEKLILEKACQILVLCQVQGDGTWHLNFQLPGAVCQVIWKVGKWGRVAQLVAAWQPGCEKMERNSFWVEFAARKLRKLCRPEVQLRNAYSRSLVHVCQIWAKHFVSAFPWYLYIIGKSKWTIFFWTNRTHSSWRILQQTHICTSSNVLFWLQWRCCISEFGLFKHLRVLSGQPTPYQALMMTTKTTEYRCKQQTPRGMH